MYPGTCVDGFCCDKDCNGQCQACNLPTLEGTCSTVGIQMPEAVHNGGLHPRQPCAGVGTSCTGLCAGDPMKCTYPDGLLGDGGVDPTHVFQMPDCTDIDAGTRYVSYPCDGTGMHQTATSDCGGFLCLDAHACRTECTEDTDCIKDHICVFPTPSAATGTCKLLTGPLCDGKVTLRRPAAQGGNTLCQNDYACPAGGTACNTSCQQVNDCAAGFACDDHDTCVAPLTAPQLPSCSCRTPAPADPAGWPPAALALAAVAVLRRRIRGSASEPEFLGRCRGGTPRPGRKNRMPCPPRP
jgi:MYXO-CTERM domain-containing protein